MGSVLPEADGVGRQAGLHADGAGFANLALLGRAEVAGAEEVAPVGGDDLAFGVGVWERVIVRGRDDGEWPETGSSQYLLQDMPWISSPITLLSSKNI